MNLKTRQDEDIDYKHKLNEKELAWLNSFNEETVNASFNNSGKKLIKGKKKRREIYQKNNSRYRDAYTQAKSKNKLTNLTEFNSRTEDYEDMLITLLDLKKNPRKRQK